MATLHLLTPFLPKHSLPNFQTATVCVFPIPKIKTKIYCGSVPPKSSSNDAPITTELPKPSRRGRKKKSSTTNDSSPSSTTTEKRPKGRPRKTQTQRPVTEKLNTKDEPATNNEEELYDYDDGIDFPYEDPPLICCFGAAQKEFVPVVRVSPEQMHPDIYSQWKLLQWKPPEFARAPGGPPSNVAISHVRLGGRAAFMGKVGDDEFGREMVLLMNKEKVQTRAVKFDRNYRTASAFVEIKFEDGKMKAEKVKESAEDSLLTSELNLAVLKEARIFHFNSEVLTSPSMHSTVFRAIAWSKKFGGLIFFDPNLPLPLWESRDKTREVLKKAWEQADIIEVSRQELEFLLDDDYYEWKRNYIPQYYAVTDQQARNFRHTHHYTREEISPLWHDGLKFLFVTDGTLHIHYYTPSFDGVINGTEDVLVTPFTCDRTGSGDAVVAAIMRKLTTQPEMFENQDVLERQLRFAVAAGIIAQWTIGAVRGFPTDGATQNLSGFPN